MKVLPFKIPKPHQDAFCFKIDEALSFYDKLHQHEEIQLCFIVEGEGTLIVGDTISYYKKGDVMVNFNRKFKSTLSKTPMSFRKNNT